MKTKSTPIVELKGYGDSLRLILDPETPIEEIEPAIKKRMANLGDSLAGMSINIDVGRRALTQKELSSLKTVLQKTYGLEVKQVINDSNRATQAAERPKIVSAPTVHQDEQIAVPDREEDTHFIRHTLRSGQVEYFLGGNVVILGDVNPGAEVIAGGDIVVLGNLRGVAHAGALGDMDSVIIALNMIPTQLRIARYITRPPPGQKRAPSRIEIARVKDDRIIVEEFKGL